MKRAFFIAISAVLAVGLVMGITGCGEDGNGEDKEPAKLLETSPANGNSISANGTLSLTFDVAVTEVKVNGIPATVTGSRATWQGQGLQVGSQTLRVDWVDENGNTGSQDITLIVEVADNIPPKVESVSIQNGSTDLNADEINDSGIVVKFSEKIDASRSKDAFALFENGNQIAWTTKWSEGDMQVTLGPGPRTKLSPGSEYTLTIKEYFDGSGNKGSAMEVKFSTAGVKLPTEDLMLWLKADEGVELRGSNVVLWEDQSGNGTDAEQANAANQPVLEENAVNGRPAVSFDGTDDFLTFTLPINGLNAMTIVLVSAATDDIEFPWPYCQSCAIFWNETASWGTAHLTPLQSTVWMRFGTGQTQPIPVSYKYKTPVGERFTLAISMMEGVTDYLYVDGELVLTNEKPAGQEAIANQRDEGNLGRGYNDNTYFPGTIAEVLVYTRALSDGEREQVEKYLSDKYGIR